MGTLLKAGKEPKRLNSRMPMTIRTLILSVIACLFVLPLVWMLFASLKTTKEVFGTSSWIPDVFQWKNYVDVWTNPQLSLPRSYLNSLIIVFVGTIGQLVVASLAAYAFAKINFKGKKIIFALFLMSMMIPSQVTIIPRFMLFYELGIYNTLWSLILPAWFSAMAIFLLRQFYMGIPDELLDAAKIDGAGHFRIFFQIMLPLTKPALISVTVLTFIALWNEYLSALIFLNNKKLYTVAQAIRWYLLSDKQQWNLTMASAASAIVPIIVLFIFSQKYFVEGVVTSGLKG